MSRQPKPQPHQRLWVVRYGTITRLVWAGSAENAERKVRTGKVDTLVTEFALESAPIRLRGPMVVKPATRAEVTLWEMCGGEPVEHYA